MFAHRRKQTMGKHLGTSSTLRLVGRPTVGIIDAWSSDKQKTEAESQQCILEKKDQSLRGTIKLEDYEESRVNAGCKSISERLITCRVPSSTGVRRCGKGDLHIRNRGAIGRSDDVLEHDGPSRGLPPARAR